MTATREERAREYAIMRALGARASPLLGQVQRAEPQRAMGLLAGVLASSWPVAVVGRWRAASLSSPWTASPWCHWWAAWQGAVLALMAGW